jgi:hypothetical protein
MNREARAPEPSRCIGEDVVSRGDDDVSESLVKTIGRKEGLGVGKKFVICAVWALCESHRALRPGFPKKECALVRRARVAHWGVVA